MRFFLFLSFCVALLLSIGCTPSINEEVVIRIAVDESGQLTADDKPVEVDALPALLEPIKELRGAVWYYRANPEAEPHPTAMEVMDMPVKLFIKPDFSEYLGPRGDIRKQPPVPSR
jgi:hypothetical protein